VSSKDEAVIAFDLIAGAWLMRFADGWYVYRDDEPRLGPFDSKAEAARAGLKAWSN
jgi:hypothetical protein